MNNVLQLKYKNQSGKFEIKNQSSSMSDLFIYGDIVSDVWSKWTDTDIAPDDVKRFLDQLDGKDKINIYINSGGGSVFAGMAIYNMLKRNKAYKTVYVDGLAGSISSVLAMVGDRIIIPANAYLMIHKAWTIQIGNSDDMLAMSETLDRIDEGILEVYKTKIKNDVSIDTIQDMVQAETWFTGKQAAQYFNIEIGEELKAVASCGYLDCYNNIPDIFKKVGSDNNTEKLNISKAKLKLLVEI